MDSDQTIFHPLIKPLIRYALKNGVSPGTLSSIIKKDVSTLNHPELKLAPNSFKQLVLLVRHKTGDPHLGIHTGELMQCGDMGLLGYMLISCRDYKEAAVKQQTYYQLCGNVCHFTLQKVADDMIYNWRILKGELEEIQQFIYEGLMAGTTSICQELSHQRLPLKSVSVKWTHPGDLTEYQRVFRSNLDFKQQSVGLSYDSKNLATIIHSANPALLSRLENHAQECQRKLTVNTPWSNRITLFLSERIQHAPSMETMARKLHVGKRTLQLKLKEEGTTYSELRDGVQFGFAKKYLQTDQYSVSEIGQLLGFSETSTFHRTFKRWAGVTPLTYRNQHIC